MAHVFNYHFLCTATAKVGETCLRAPRFNVVCLYTDCYYIYWPVSRCAGVEVVGVDVRQGVEMQSVPVIFADTTTVLPLTHRNARGDSSPSCRVKMLSKTEV